MASQVTICNLALLKFGDKSIASIDDETAEARACKALYDMERNMLLYSHPWNFAMKRAELVQLGTDPAFEYDYQYALPNDCLRAWELYSSTANWVIEGCVLLTNEDEVYLRYIAKITDPTYYSPLFIDCLALKLGAELATKLGEAKTTKEGLLKELRSMLLMAYQVNALEGKRPIPEDEQEAGSGNFSWQTEGR